MLYHTYTVVVSAGDVNTSVCFVLEKSVFAVAVRGATVAALAGLALPLALPPLHMAVLSKYWSKYTRRVERQTCSCSCWDTIFKVIDFSNDIDSW
jgi:hypothetical protein